VNDRYARQRLLAAVGDLGQQRIAAASYVLSDDADGSADVEREYLARAGARHFAAPSEVGAAFVHAGHFRDAGARAFAAGAWRALCQLKGVIERD
jgi:hypothetical protein